MFIALTLLFACGNRIDEEVFLSEYSQEYCANIFGCVSEEDLPTIQEFYGSEEDCATSMENEIKSNMEAASLVYDPVAAKSCVDTLSEISCEAEPEEYDICNLVYVEQN